MSETIKLSVQEYLSLGYLYLLVLGLITDSIYYDYLDLNILEYSSISDVLLSPLKIMVRSKIVFIALILIVFFIFSYTKWIYPKLIKTFAKDKEINVITQDKLLSLAALMIVAYFLGIGIGLGHKTSKLISSGKTRQDHRITFSNTRSLDVKIVGRNSLYIFYVLKGGKKVISTPIEGNILAIQKLPGFNLEKK